MLGGEGHEIGGRRGAARGEPDGSGGHLAQSLVGQPHDGRLDHRRVLLERRLHLDGVHRVPAPLDDVLGASREADGAERPAAGQVARAQPPVVGEDGLGGRHVAPVARRDARALHPELADLPGAHGPAFVVDDLEAVAGQWGADAVTRQQPVEQGQAGLHGHRARRLGQAVALEEDGLADGSDEGQLGGGAETLEPVGEVGGHDVGPRGPHPDTRQVPFLRTGLQEEAVHGRHAHEDRGASLLQGVEHVVGPEPREHVGRHTAAGQAEEDGEPHDVGDREGHDRFVAPQRHVTDQGAAREAPEEAAVGELDALGPARRARRVEERRDVTGRRWDGPTQRLGTLELVGRPHHHIGARHRPRRGRPRRGASAGSPAPRCHRLG